MVRIVDKNTRIIDVDFGTLDVSIGRSAGDSNPTSVVLAGNGRSQLLTNIPAGAVGGGGGSYIQYSRVDLSFMTKENEIMLPVSVNVQRTSPVPLGYSNNGNTYDQVEEYIYIFTRPLNNADIEAVGTLNGTYQNMRNLGLDGSEQNSVSGGVVGQGGSVPNLAQCVFAEKRMYNCNTNIMATKTNGMLDTIQPDYNTIEGMMSLASVTSWGSLDAITGPNLHCYRVIIDRGQSLLAIPGLLVNEQLTGASQRIWPPVNIAFVCKDPSYSEGEYLTRVANAMANTPEGGQTA